MPQFRKLTGSFAIRTGQPPDEIVWHFARTPSIERGFTAGHAIDESAARAKALLALMLEGLRNWEGVSDEKGQPLPYSLSAFFQRIPARLRAEVLRRWIAAMLGAPADGEAESATAPQEGSGAAVAGSELPPAEDQPPSSTPSSSGDEIGSEARPDEHPPQLPFRMEASDRPANEGAFDTPRGPASHEPPAQPSLPFTDPSDPAPQRTTSPPPEAPDASRQAPRPPELPTAAAPDPRGAQVPSLRPLPSGAPQQARPTAQATPSAPATVSAARPAQARPSEVQPTREPATDWPPAFPSCTDQVCPLLDPDFDWQPLIRPAWEALHKQTRREETAEAAF